MRISQKINLILFLIFILAITLSVDTKAQLADSPWPMFHRDIRHTGLSKYDTSHVDGTLKWTFETGGGIESSPIIGTDGTIYVGSHDNKLYAINPDGTEKWHFNAGSPVYSKIWDTWKGILSTPAIGTDGTIYFTSLSNFLFAVRPDGTEKWRYPVHVFVNVWSSPVIDSDGTIYVGSECYPTAESGEKQLLGGRLYAINPDGTEKWHYDSGSSGMSASPAISNEGTIYISSGDWDNTKGTFVPAIYAFNRDGTIKRRFLIGDMTAGSVEGITIGEDGTLYFGTESGIFYALNSDGKEKWRFKAGDGISAAPAIGKDKTIYIGSWDSYFYAFKPDGTEKWRLKTKAAPEAISSSAAIGADGTIYFGLLAGYFYAFTPDGKEKWKVDAPGGGIVSSPAIGKDGTIYVGTVPGELLAIGAGSAPTINQSVSNQTISVQTADANTRSSIPSKNNVTNKLFVPFAIVSGVSLVVLLLAFVLHFKWYKWVELIAIISLAISISFFIYFEKNKATLIDLPIQVDDSVPVDSLIDSVDNESYQTNGKQAGDYYNQTCPDRIYSKAENPNLLYAVLGDRQWNLTLTRQIDWISNNCPNTIWPESSTSTSQEVNYDKDREAKFEQNAFLVSETHNVKARFFGETARSCLDSGCTNYEETCIRWNKYKDQCYESAKTCSLPSCQKYKIYCELVVIDQDQVPVDITFDANYVTADGAKHFVQKQTYHIEGGHGRPFLWEYDVNTENIGKCSYSDLRVNGKEKKDLIPYCDKDVCEVSEAIEDCQGNCNNGILYGSNTECGNGRCESGEEEYCHDDCGRIEKLEVKKGVLDVIIYFFKRLFGK